MGTALYLEPLNLFFYTWRFLATLESEEDNRLLKRVYRFVSLFSIIVLPSVFIGVYVAFVILYARAVSYLDEEKTVLAAKFYQKYLKIDETLGYLQLTCNLFACVVLVLVIRLVNKMTKVVGYGLQTVEKERRFNQTMTLAHIGLVLGYTVVSIMAFNIKLTGAD